MTQAIGHSCEKNPTLFCSELNGLMPFIFFVFPTIVMKATCRLICSSYRNSPPPHSYLFTCDTKEVLLRDREGVRVGLHPLD